MGSHRARHRADQNQSEELATDLLARLADEARPRPARRRNTESRPALDPFSTAPFPAHPPQTAEADALPSDEGRPEVADQPSGVEEPTPVPDDIPGVRPGDEAHGAADGAADNAGYIPAPRFPTDPGAPFPLDDAADFRAPFPRDAAPAGLPTAPRTGRDRLATLRSKPVYAAVSVSMITAAAAAAAAAGPTAITPPAPTPAPAASPALAAAAMDLGPKPGQPPAPVVPQAAGGVAVLVPEQGSADAPDNSPVLGSSIAARAAADAKAYAAEQARQAASRATAAPAAPKHAPKPAPRPAAAPAAPLAGTGVGARALGLARGKLGDPYVWGAAGPNAFDCSGLIVWAYKQLGVSLPHSSATLSTMGTPVSKAALQPGDLVFFYSPVSHVGIYAGNGVVLNATQSGEPVQFSKLANLPFHNAVRITR